MKQTLKRIIRNVKSINGNSLAEFATTTALMATLAATAAPKLSEMSEGTKAEKSMNEIDKILTQARNHYQTTADEEGRGRFPGQEKYNCDVGGYMTENTPALQATHADRSTTALDAVYDDLAEDEFNSYQEQDISKKWSSVFGTSRPAGSDVADDGYTQCSNCSASDDSYGKVGSQEWLTLFNGNSLESRFQDGHFIYVVVPGGGSGTGSFLVYCWIPLGSRSQDICLYIHCVFK